MRNVRFVPVLAGSREGCGRGAGCEADAGAGACRACGWGAAGAGGGDFATAASLAGARIFNAGLLPVALVSRAVGCGCGCGFGRGALR